jgi:formate dehydrogenase major subunit/formate dehydrogenase alpha subunit
MSNSMQDVAEQAELLFIIGSNTTEQHPVFGAKLRQAVIRRGAKLIVADPRRIDLTEFATLHLRQRPGTDIALLNGLMYLILENGWQDQAFIDERCENFDEFKATVQEYPPEKVSQITGISVADLRQAAQMMGETHPMAVIWAMGITQHIVGVRNVMDLANLQMLTGNMGKPGGGVNPLRGQNNVQGACDMGGLPNVYPAYQPVTNEEVRKRFAAAWGLDGGPKTKDDEASVRRLSPSVGLTVTEMMPGLLDGRVHALYILAEDPIMSDPDTSHIRHCLEAADFVVLQEIFPTETAHYADVLLPGVTFAEKSGTFTNTERRVQPVHPAIEPLGEARQDWEIIRDLAQKILDEEPRTEDREPRSLVHGPWSSWNYTSPADILREINALTPSYAGITPERLENGETLQWPCPTAEHPGTPILHTKGFARGKGRFMPIDHLPPAERPNDDYPMILSTGRVLYHWHGGEMTRRAQGLLEVYPQALIEVSPWDAEKLSLQPDQSVRVTSRRGVIEAKAWVTDRVPPGMVYANFHFPNSSANELTHASLDPVSKIPEYKITAVKVEAVQLFVKKP